MSSDTIVAISTPPGRGGIGIVRLSGPDAVAIAHQLLATENLEHARARYTRVVDPTTGSVLDEALATAFLAPHSYTGEDVVEIATHGAPVILHAVLENALAAGNRLNLPVRLAEPGEFTQRAFANGRLDLTQAEAVHDLIAARTLDQARQAAQQLGGALSRRLAPAKAQLVYLIALLEAGMDFASGELDDVDVVAPEHIAAEVSTITASLQTLAATYARGHLLRSGAALALVGRPNAGKSSLFNRLLERERAIVTATPGTTRDTVEESLSLAGIPLRLVDTAGLRGIGGMGAEDDTPADEAEALGIARSREALADADLVLLVHDATQPLTRGEEDLLAALAHRPHLVVLNKADLLPLAATQRDNAIETSALTGNGVPELRTAILHLLRADTAISDTAALTTPRQLAALQSALDALAGAAQANTDRLPHEALLLDLHAALTAIDSLTGQTTPDDILAVIFSTFCIGK